MAWRVPLSTLLLPLLLSGSWADSKAQKFQKVAGQTLSVRCQYSPKSVTYQRKSWCRETSVSLCTMLVTSPTPWTLVQASRFSIWDNPSAGFFIVTMENLKEEDSGHYWCAMYHTSSNSVFKSVKLYLSVSPASASTWTTWSPRNLISSQPQSPVPQTGEASRAPPANPVFSPSCPSASRLQNSTLLSGPAASTALVPVLSGLLVIKSLGLSALFLW
uniref:Natural cytotoxicity triggering receptor 2 n=1 Tax=Castor canadensis TaxID=51338 RepID=A0A8B7TZ33_CASCN|nr:natural cytotoxicity triggering receptor 2 [Castor canadensis]